MSNVQTIYKSLESKNKDKVYPLSQKIKTLSGNGKLYSGDKHIVKVLKTSGDTFKKETVYQHIAHQYDIAPEVLQVYETKKGEGVIVMEKLEHSLSDLLQPIKYDDEKVSILAKQIYELVEKLHSLNIYHNDLHTDNIMIDGYGKLKLIDFGEASEEKNDHEYTALLQSDFQLFNNALRSIV